MNDDAWIKILLTFIAAVFAYLRIVDARQQRRIEDCEKDRRDLWREVFKLGGSKPRRDES